MRTILSFLVAVCAASSACASGGEEERLPDGMTTITTDEHSFRATIEGDPENEPVILLHGFPETSAMWRDLQTQLAGNGYYAIAPDQRGYSPGAARSEWLYAGVPLAHTTEW